MKSLRSSLIILLLAVLLPILIFATVQAVNAARQEREAFELSTQARVRQVIEELDRQLYGEIKVLQILSFSDLLHSDDLARFYDLAQRVVATEPNITHILLADPATVQKLTKRLQAGSVVHKKAKDILRASGLALLPADNHEVASNAVLVVVGSVSVERLPFRS